MSILFGNNYVEAFSSIERKDQLDPFVRVTQQFIQVGYLKLDSIENTNRVTQHFIQVGIVNPEANESNRVTQQFVQVGYLA